MAIILAEIQEAVPPTAEDAQLALESSRRLTKFLAAKPKDSPFYFWAGLTEPHAPWGPDNHKEIGVDLKDLKLPEFLPDTKGVRINRANYLYEVQHADRTLGAILKLLEEAGELENTLVIVTADNGTPVPRAKANVYDWGVHVPLAMMWPASLMAIARSSTKSKLSTSNSLRSSAIQVLPSRDHRTALVSSVVVALCASPTMMSWSLISAMLPVSGEAWLG